MNISDETKNQISLGAFAAAVKESEQSGMPGQTNGPGDAYRHIMLAAELTRLFGEEAAGMALDRHEVWGRERDGWSQGAEEMDRHNNQIGIEIGKTAKSWEEIVERARDQIDPNNPNGEDGRWMPEDKWDTRKDLPVPNWPPQWEEGPYFKNPYDVIKGNFSDLLKFLIPPYALVSSISNAIDIIRDLFQQATQQGSPLILDIDNDGIETTAVKAGTYFDHGGDAFAEQSGWVGKDDGLLVLDRNDNGRIDTGAELFGNNTLLANGAKAANGFAALAELDANHDGTVDAQDAAFAGLRVWKDSNGDGISATNELLTLAEAGVQAIATGYTTSTLVDGGGNAHKQTGSYTRTDGSTATATDVWFAVDRAHSVATEWLDVPTDIAALPDAKGYGTVYNLHQAMIRDESGVLKSLVGQFVAADTVAERNILVEKIIYKWAGVDGVISDSRGPYVDARKLGSLEVFLDDKFLQRDAYTNPFQQAGADITQGFEALKELVYGQLAAQTHLSTLYHRITYSYDDATQTLRGNLGAIAAELPQSLQADRAKSLDTLADFARSLKGLGLLDMMDRSGFIAALAPLGFEVSGIVDGVWNGLAPTGSNDTLSGTSGNDYLRGLEGADNILGNAGNDTLIGGRDSDILDGGAGDDTYIFNAGDGVDIINNTDMSGTDTLAFGQSIVLDDLYDFRGLNNNLVFKVGTGGDQITINNWFGATYYQLDRFTFADGTVKSGAELLAGKQVLMANNQNLTGTAGDDLIIGNFAHDTVFGLAGNDTMDGGEGNDNLNGGTGNDLLTGGMGIDILSGDAGNDILTGGVGNDTQDGGAGDDTYMFNLGDGADLINNYDTAGVDTVSFGAGIALTDINLTKDSNNLKMKVGGNGDQLTILGWFSSGYNQLDRFTFADGSVKSSSELLATLPMYAFSALPLYENGTSVNDSLTGYEGVDIMNGGAGNNSIYGCGGNDSIFGGAGNGDDLLRGHAGNDILSGGLDNDVLEGGEDDDTYLFDAGDGQDTSTTTTPQPAWTRWLLATASSLLICPQLFIITLTPSYENGTAVGDSLYVIM